MTKTNDARPVAWRQRHQRVNGGDWAFSHRPLNEEERNVGWESESLYSAATVEALRAEVAENEGVLSVWCRRCDEVEQRVAQLEALALAAYGRLRYLNIKNGERIDADLASKLATALDGATHD